MADRPRDKYSTETYDEYIDPSMRAAVNNMTNANAKDTDPEIAMQKGQLKINKLPEFNSGTALNEAVMKRARDKFYDPAISEGLQKMRYVENRAGDLQNSANQIMSIYKLDKQAEQISRERKAAEDAQRAQVLSSVLGLGGAVVGGAYGGGAGAMAGAQVGSSIGKSASGSKG